MQDKLGGPIEDVAVEWWVELDRATLQMWLENHMVTEDVVISIVDAVERDPPPGWRR